MVSFLRQAKALRVLVLLAVLFAYNIDLECIVESSADRQACHVDSADDCGAPSLSVPVTLGPSAVVIVLPPVREVFADLSVPDSRVEFCGDLLCRPLGLRAPPQSAA